MELDKLLKQGYELFAPYAIGSTLRVCKACCVTEAEEKELVSTPLRQVSRSLLQNAYYESARDYSDQELREMKHFLPRVLELVSDFEFPAHSTEITFTRLDLDQPARWTAPEVAFLNAFARAFFQKCLRQYPLPDGSDLAEMLVMFGLAHFELGPLLQTWEDTATPASARHLTSLLCYGVQNLGAALPGLTDPFSEPHVDEVVAAWLHDERVRRKLADQLANLMRAEPLDELATTEVSVARELLGA